MIQGLLRSFRARLLLMMLAAAAPAFGVILYASIWLRTSAIEQGQDHLLDLAQTLVAEYQERINQVRQPLAALGHVPAVTMGPVADCEARLGDVLRQGPGYIANLLVLRPDGQVACSARTYDPAANLSGRAYFRHALTTTGFRVGNYHLSPRSGRPTVLLTYTLREAGQVTVVLAAAVDLAELSRDLLAGGLPPGAAYVLVDRQGVILLHQPDPEQGVGRLLADHPAWPSLGEPGAAGTFRGSGADGVPRLVAHIPLDGVEAPKARLLVGMPEEVAEAAAGRLLGFGLAGLAVASLLGLAIGWYGGSALVWRPMRPIFDAVRRVAAGDLKARTGLHASGDGEIGRLAREVDRMADTLAARDAELRQSLRDSQLQLEALALTSRERRQAESALLGVAEAVPGILYRARLPDCATSYVSPQLELVLGFAPEEFVARPELWAQRIEPADRDRVFAEIHAALDSAATEFRVEYRMRARDGRLLWISDRGRFVREEDGGEIIGVMTDVTERITLAEERERLQGQLQQAQKMEALGQLTAGIAHDFNNMLASMLGFAKLALQRHVPDKAGPLAEYLGEIVEAGERGRDLVAKMLAFSRSEPLHVPHPVAPQRLLDEGIRLLAGLIPEGMTIRCHCEPDLPEIGLEPVAFQQVLVNLILNARDATAGLGEITVALARVHLASEDCAACHGAFGGEFLELSVADHGSGIAPEVLPHIFEPFFTTKTVGKGTGMGLSVVHGLVCRAGGLIRVDSRLGQGTRIRVCFPLRPPALPGADAGAASTTLNG